MSYSVIVRKIREGDAEEFLDLCRRIDAETPFMMFEPGERPTAIEEQKDEIRAILSSNNQTVFVAEKDRKLIGYLTACGGRYKRNRQTAYIITGILQEFAAQGIGTRLFEEMERWAREKELHRLELSVMVHNEAALALYKKMGFEIEGKKKQSLLVNNSYVDEYWMAKLL